MKRYSNVCTVTVALFLAAIGWLPREGAAAEKSMVNPTGTWQVTHTQSGKSQTYRPTLTLKLEGGKLTGTLSRRHNQENIEMILQDAQLKGSEISFTVSIPPASGNSPNVTQRFRGKITGDVIKGTVEREWVSQLPTLDWEAKRVKE